MRLPFLQVSQEELARARTLAGYLSVPFAHALGMTVALKAAALEAAPDGDVSGAIRDPNPAEWMAVQCGWPLDRAGVLASALLRCGFAMAGPQQGYSVAGMEPYAKALDTSRRHSEAGRLGAETRKARGGYGPAMAKPQPRDSQGMARDGKTQTQTQTQTQKEETLPVADAPDAVKVLVAQAPLMPEAVAEKPESPGTDPAALQALWNRLAVPKGLQRWESMSKARLGASRAALASVPDLAKWEAWLAHELNRPFNLGQNGTGWRADVDWLLRAKTRDLVADFNPAAVLVVDDRDRPRLGPKPVTTPPVLTGDRPRL